MANHENSPRSAPAGPEEAVPSETAATRAASDGTATSAPTADEGSELTSEASPEEERKESEGVPQAGDAVAAEVADPVAAKAAKADEYLALAQRTQADFENYRKRALREAASAQERGVIKLAKELLPAVDDLDRALTAAQNAGDGADDALVSGIKLVHADVVAALSRVGIEQYSPHGQPFDPQHHEAMAQQPVEGAEPGTIVEVYQRGYKLGDTVIRPARVVVAG
jgi:molecular chaperone GrpE